MKKNKGITLVALIITIVIMLILVAVSVNVIVNSDLIGHAEKTGDAYKNAIANEERYSPTLGNGKTLEYYIAGIEKLPDIEAGERAETNSNYKGATIPKGFTVSGIKEEQSIDGGLVIYDIPDDEVKNIKWDGTEMTQYNQFVWVPTTEEGFIRTEWTEDGRRGESLENSTTYIEPFEGLTEELKIQIAQLNKSVIKYGGFYIGRYEAGSAIARSEETTDNPIPEVKRSKYPYTYISFDEACDLSHQMYNTSNYGAKSIICTGRCFDTTLNYLLDETHRINNRYEWGIESSSRGENC